MSEAFAFGKKQDVRDLLNLLRRETELIDKPPSVTATVGWIFQTPTGGIPKRNGTTVVSAECSPFFIDSGTMTEITDSNGDPTTLPVYNIFGSDIAGSVYITVKEVYGNLVADAEDCP